MKKTNDNGIQNTERHLRKAFMGRQPTKEVSGGRMGQSAGTIYRRTDPERMPKIRKVSQQRNKVPTTGLHRSRTG